jgi:ABC-type sulfate/molybdate transport systems ATPase subunit
MLFTSHDHKFIITLANRVVKITPGGVIDRVMTFDEYLENADVNVLRERLYCVRRGLAAQFMCRVSKCGSKQFGR